MKRQLSHLITGSELAIKNGPDISNNVKTNNEAKLWMNDYAIKMQMVLRHYQEGGSIFNRP